MGVCVASAFFILQRLLQVLQRISIACPARLNKCRVLPERHIKHMFQLRHWPNASHLVVKVLWSRSACFMDMTSLVQTVCWEFARIFCLNYQSRTVGSKVLLFVFMQNSLQFPQLIHALCYLSCYFFLMCVCLSLVLLRSFMHSILFVFVIAVSSLLQWKLNNVCHIFRRQRGQMHRSASHQMLLVQDSSSQL
jgi:hypothetical protein